MSKLDDKLVEIYKYERYSGDTSKFFSKIYSCVHMNSKLNKEQLLEKIYLTIEGSDYRLDNLDFQGEDFKYDIKFDIVKDNKLYGDGYIKTRKAYYLNNPEVKFSSIDKYGFKTTLMSKIRTYYEEYLLESEKLFVNMGMNPNISVDYDSKYMNYIIEKVNAKDYSNCISGDIKKYYYNFDYDNLLDYKRHYKNLKKLVELETWSDIMKYAKEALGYEEEKITWKAYGL